MTHEYTILHGGVVIPGGGAPDARAICWAGDTVLLVGSDADALAISRGDSHFIDLAGAVVAAMADDARLEVGAPADFAVLATDPRLGPTQTLALVRGGRVVDGELPGALGGHRHDQGAPHRLDAGVS